MEQQSHITAGSQHLAEAVAARGLGTAALGQALGCSQPHASRILTGARSPSKTLMRKIFEEFGIDPRSWLERQP
tara:strand:+ start:523 stop:744 length:222 start_codon:yes stop_codon:yes gene_type:complete